MLNFGATEVNLKCIFEANQGHHSMLWLVSFNLMESFPQNSKIYFLALSSPFVKIWIIVCDEQQSVKIGLVFGQHAASKSLSETF